MNQYLLVRSNSQKGVHEVLGIYKNLKRLRFVFPVSIYGHDSALDDIPEHEKDEWSVYVNLLDANGNKIKEISDPRVYREDA